MDVKLLKDSKRDYDIGENHILDGNLFVVMY